MQDKENARMSRRVLGIHGRTILRFSLAVFALAACSIFFRRENTLVSRGTASFEELSAETNEQEVLTTLGGKEWCEMLMTLRKIQAPKNEDTTGKWPKAAWGSASQEEKKQWEDIRCVDLLGLYKPIVLKAGDSLPKGTLKPRLSLDEELLLEKILRTTIQYLVDQDIWFIVSFGTLLSVERHGLLVVPWDDDIDLNVYDDFAAVRKKLEAPLASTTRGGHCQSGWFSWFDTSCNHHILPKELSGDLEMVLTSKTAGIPFKVSKEDESFPAIDMNTFKDGSEGVVHTPRPQLRNGHIHKFDKKYSDIFPIQWKQVRFSARINRTIAVPVPANSVAVLQDDYGKDVFEECMTSYSHRNFCKKGESCENPMANHLAKMKFPCQLLPEVFHGKAQVTQAPKRFAMHDDEN